MKKIILILICSFLIFAGCSSVSTTHEDGSKTVLYPDGTVEHID